MPANDNLQLGPHRDGSSNSTSALPDVAAAPLGSAADLAAVVAPALAGRVTAKTAMNAGAPQHHHLADERASFSLRLMNSEDHQVVGSIKVKSFLQS